MTTEYGLPIARQTRCKVGAHSFVKVSLGGPSPFAAWDRCDCGLLSYGEATLEAPPAPTEPQTAAQEAETDARAWVFATMISERWTDEQRTADSDLLDAYAEAVRASERERHRALVEAAREWRTANFLLGKSYTPIESATTVLERVAVADA